MPSRNGDETLTVDIDADFAIDPITGDVAGVGERRGGIQSFIDLVRTRFGERPWDSSIGRPELLFNNSNRGRVWEIEQALEQIAAEYARDIVLRDFSVESSANTNRLVVHVVVSLQGSSQDTFNFRLTV